MKITDDEIRVGLVKVAVDMQLRITDLTKRYREELRKYYYVTPTSFLELLSTFEKMNNDRMNEIEN